MRRILTVTIGDQVATFNLASYIKALSESGFGEGTKEMRIALALYNYSECSEAYKRS
jgi:hypothetical protein